MNSKEQEMILSLEKVQKITDKEKNNLFAPLQNCLPKDNLTGFELNPAGEAVARYKFNNGYGARVIKEKDEYVMITVRQSGGGTGDSGPAVELEDWLFPGSLEQIKGKLNTISELPQRDTADKVKIDKYEG